MSFTEKIDVLELMINLLNEKITNLDSLLKKLETEYTRDVNYHDNTRLQP